MTPISIQDAITVVHEWLNSDDVFVTNGPNGEKIPNAWIDCVKGSLLKRLANIKHSDEYLKSLKQQ